MKVLSIANFKGGCGKTTSAYYLAKLMSMRRVKTLVVTRLMSGGMRVGIVCASNVGWCGQVLG